METERQFDLKIPGISWMVPIRRISPSIEIALINVIDHPFFTEIVGKMIFKRMIDDAIDVDAILMPEGKATPLLHIVQREFTRETQRFPSAVVVRKQVRSYMRLPYLFSNDGGTSMTTPTKHSFVLDGDDIQKLTGRRVVILDDVVSTGGTVIALQELLQRCSALVVGIYAIATEGAKPMPGVSALTHLPLSFP